MPGYFSHLQLCSQVSFLFLLISACHRLAAFYKSIQQDVPKASKVFKRNCDDYGYGHSCYEYAQHAMVGKGGNILVYTIMAMSRHMKKRTSWFFDL